MFQEGDTALNLVIKSSRLRDTGEMHKCAEILVNNGALSTFKDLVNQSHILNYLIVLSMESYFIKKYTH